jgi:hypothetical protein
MKFEFGCSLAGELDWFINGKLCWGIEAMIQGQLLSLHVARFGATGKHRALNCTQWRVIDFRNTNIGSTTLRQNLIVVQFPKLDNGLTDFSKAQVHGMGGSWELTLVER